MRRFLLLLLFLGMPILCSSDSSSSCGAIVANSLAESALDRDPKLLEIGPAPKEKRTQPLSANLKVVSYNIRWRGGDDLRKLAALLKDDPEIGGAAILGLQEVDRKKKRSGNKNNAAILAEELGMYYAWAAPPVVESEEEEETGVQILSAYPLTDVRRLLLPHEGPGGRRRVALGATVRIGKTDIRVYSVHAETRLPVNCKLDQMKAVLADLACYSSDMPAVVLGDLNTWEPATISKTFELFAAAKFHTPFDEQPTFLRRVLFVPIELKLDWIWLRNLSASSHGIDQTVTLSDHWPLWVTLTSDKL
ncbi:MAG TPA: endonuclease/exonuclease/phosphatase family protein [Pyrinomonadaceae bacterium]|nr:endonuclease/exonuclease/phosphatase family protein [Pyrinomonadaceae bacterium]